MRTFGFTSESRAAAASSFGRPDVGRPEEDLAVQVRLVDDVEVDEAERADAGGREIQRGRRAEAARADEQERGPP